MPRAGSRSPGPRAPGDEDDVTPDTATPDVFTELLAQLRREHWREVEELRDEILRLSSRPPQADPSVSEADEECRSEKFEEHCSERPRPVDRPEGRRAPSHASSALDSTATFEMKRKSSVTGLAFSPMKSFPRSFWEGIQRTSATLTLTAPRNFLKSVTQEANYSRVRPLRVLEQMVNSNYFEAAISCVIALNAVLMAIEVELVGKAVGAELERGGGPASSGASSFFGACATVFGVIFALELVLRLVALRFRFLCDPWYWLDALIVVVWIISTLQHTFAINPQLIRLCRLGRLVRLLRPLRRMQNLESLVLMMTSLKGSLSILGWTVVLLLLILTFDSMLINQLLVEFYFTNGSYPLSERQELYRYFGSFSTSLFSMFELTLANWPPISRMLYEYVSEWFLPIALLHKLTIGFAVVGVINGVFMQETFTRAQQDDELMYRRARSAKKIHTKKMRQLMEAADMSGDDALDIHEFRAIFQNADLKSWLAAMDFVPRDVDTVFKLMSFGRDILSVDDMIEGVAQYKGHAKSVDLHTLMLDLQWLVREYRDLQSLIREQSKSLRDTRSFC